MTLSPRLAIDGAAEYDEVHNFLHQFFENACRQWPDRPAVDIPPGVGRPHRRIVSYRELEQQANALAYALRKFVEGESVVAILLPIGTEYLYSSQLAILKSGAAYTCIDPAFPDDQIRDILEDSQPVALLTDNEGQDRIRHLGFDSERLLNAVDLLAEPDTMMIDPRTPPWLTPSSLAYIIYTSGTTGRPKGVLIEHGSIVNLVGSDIEEFHLSPQDRVGQSSSPAYDSSVEEVWLAFAAGATVVVMDDDTTRLGPDLVSWLRRERLTVLCPPPTLLRTTGCEHPETELPELSLLYVGGEALPGDVADRWAKGRRLVNGYGPTECTVTALRARIKEREPITIGRPVRNLRAWVLDESLEEVREGEQGELCLGGMGLARGYRNRPELTAQKFFAHPRFGRIYRTGDLVSRDPDGSFFYFGRIDSQVKLRGYRVELEAVESRLADCEGVREAACRVQGEGSRQMLVAFIIPEGGIESLSFDHLKASLRKVLPAYMVPSRFAILSELPKAISGKLNRKELPYLEAQEQVNKREVISPSNRTEARLEEAFRKVLAARSNVSIQDDFFNDLGGDSLKAAELISLLRNDPFTSSFTVRDLYEARTVAELAKRKGDDNDINLNAEEGTERAKGHPFLTTIVQAAWLLTGLVFGSTVVYFAAFIVMPFLIRGVGLIPFLLLSPIIFFAALLVYSPFAILITVLIKKILIGKYRPLRAPVWGSFYARNWMVQLSLKIVPWRLLEGTVFQVAALRALGARIGWRAHIHRGVNLLQGGWDLLEIGDDVTISQDASIRLVDLDCGQIVAGPVSLGEGSTLGIRAGVAACTVLEPEACLTALSFLPSGGRILRGQQWHGIPAQLACPSPPRPSLSDEAVAFSPLWHGVMMILARVGIGLLLALTLEVPAIVFALVYGVDAKRALGWLSNPSINSSMLIVIFLIVTLPLPLMLALEALSVRFSGRVRAGLISRWSLSYIRVSLKTGLVQSAGHWLSGTLFWLVWLRLAGMKVGRGCEISTIIDVVPELIEIGPESFFADGIYLGGPDVYRGTVTLAATRLGKNTFLGNHVVIPAGQYLPEDILLGVCAVADDKIMRAGTSWFGHPPFELPRREVVECERRLTHDPSLIRYLNRVFWELLRFSLPVIPALALAAWFKLLATAETKISWPLFLSVIVPSVNLGTAAFFCILVLALKWGLLGRVRPGTHPLWSCWCSRWDFLYVAWGVYARPALSVLEGTLLLACYLRAMGARVGRRVILGGGFAQVVDPDMLTFEDGATVCCQFQAHTFEDRVLKIDMVRIRRDATVEHAAVLLYGADIGERTHVAPHSVVMKRESLLPRRAYAGCPTRPLRADGRNKPLATASELSVFN